MSHSSNRELQYNERIRKASQGHIQALNEHFSKTSHAVASPEDLRTEVKNMSAKKAEELFSSEKDRKLWIESIRTSVEQSLQNQVRAVLGTPPEVKRKRRCENKQQQHETQNINSRNFKQSPVNSKGRNFIFLKDSDYRFKFEKDKYGSSDETYLQTTSSESSLDPLSDDFNKILSPYTRAALENVNVESLGQNITRKTVQEPYRRAPGSVWKDSQGKEHNLPGPFWPKDHLPLFSNQKHIDYVPEKPELLNNTGNSNLRYCI